MEAVTALAALGALKSVVIVGSAIHALTKTDLPGILNTFADIEFSSAQRVLRDAQESNTPQRELTMVLSYLHIAREEFLRLGGEDSRRNAYVCSALIATVYSRLGEDRLAQQYLRQFRDDFENYYNYWRFTMLPQFVNQEELKAVELAHNLGYLAWQAKQRKNTWLHFVVHTLDLRA